MRHRSGIEYVDGVEDGFDFDAHYSNKGMPGVAFVALGWEPRWEASTTLEVDPETGKEYEVDSGEGGQLVPDVGGRIGVRMVGDDRVFYVDREELQTLAREDYCGECGQIGCCHDGLDRTEAQP